MSYKLELHTRYNLEFDYYRHKGKIEDLKIRKSNINLDSLDIQKSYQNKQNKILYKPYNPSKVEKYCIDRLMRIYKTWDTNLYNATVVAGYYGEEIGEITFLKNQELLNSIIDIFTMVNDLERVKAVLNKEYKFLLDVVKNANSLKIEQIYLNKIVFNEDYLSRLKNEDYPKYIMEKVPCGILTKNNDGTYRLIDGYHRYLEMLDTKIKNAEYIVLEN